MAKQQVINNSIEFNEIFDRILSDLNIITNRYANGQTKYHDYFSQRNNLWSYGMSKKDFYRELHKRSKVQIGIV